MLFELSLEKKKSWWWDEDTCGKCIFNAKNDQQALAFALTIIYSINKRYNRINELRGVFIRSIYRLEDSDFGHNRILVDLNQVREPLKGFGLIRKALNSFYLKRDGEKHRSSLMFTFCDYRPTPKETPFL